MDEAVYADAAERLWAGVGLGADYTRNRVPGYPVFLALVDFLVPGGVLALRLGQAALVAFGALLCFDLGRRLGGPAAGLAAAALYSLDPLLILSAGLLYPEARAALLLCGSVLAAWQAVQRDRLLPALIAGLLLGVLTLFRPMGLALAPAMIGWVGLAPGWPWRRRAAHAAVLIGAWAIVLAPYAVSQLHLHGRVIPTTFAGLRGVPTIWPEVERSGVPGAVAGAIQRDPPGFARRTLREFGHFWELYPTRLITDDPARRAGLSERDSRVSSAPVVQRSGRNIVSAVSFGLELALAAIGLVVAWRHRRRETVWLVVLVLSFALGYSLFFGKLRYRIPILPIVLAFAGLGAATLADRLTRWRTPRPSGSVATSP